MNLLRNLFYSVTACIVLFLIGCGSLLPSVKETKRTDLWGTFDEAKTAFESIIPNKTTVDDLHKLGFDPASTPNLKILSYLDIIHHFMFNPSIKKEDLDTGVQACIDAKTNCRAYEISLSNIAQDRYGNVLLDLFNFRRRTKETGWEFEALIVMVNGTVVHKFWGGTPIINAESERKNPLGPLQDSSDLLKERALRPLRP
jgi:hypothetical protein